MVDFSQSDTVAISQINPLSWGFDLEDIEKDSGKLLQKKTMGETQSKSDKHRFYKGNVLYSKLRPYLNKVIVADDDGYCTTEILAFDFGQYIDARYAQIFLMSPYFVDYAMAGSYGVKMPRIGNHRGNSSLMPLPPYSEQKKIIVQAKELFDCLIKEIVLYDDKIEIYFNSPIKLSPDESRGFTFYTENIKITYKDPHWSEPVVIQAVFETKI